MQLSGAREESAVLPGQRIDVALITHRRHPDAPVGESRSAVLVPKLRRGPSAVAQGDLRRNGPATIGGSAKDDVGIHHRRCAHGGGNREERVGELPQERARGAIQRDQPGLRGENNLAHPLDGGDDRRGVGEVLVLRTPGQAAVRRAKGHQVLVVGRSVQVHKHQIIVETRRSGVLPGDGRGAVRGNQVAAPEDRSVGRVQADQFHPARRAQTPGRRWPTASCADRRLCCRALVPSPPL